MEKNNSVLFWKNDQQMQKESKASNLYYNKVIGIWIEKQFNFQKIVLLHSFVQNL